MGHQDDSESSDSLHRTMNSTFKQRALNRSLPARLNQTTRLDTNSHLRPLNLGLPQRVSQRFPSRLTEEDSEENIFTTDYNVMSESFLKLERDIAAEAQRARDNVPVGKLIDY